MSLPPPDRRPVLHDGDGWVDCRCGAQHWGRYGAAGLLLAAAPGAGEDDGDLAVVLQHRALWSHHGGTWGIPGGALAPGERPAAGALREAVEEAGVPQDGVRVWASSVLEHGDWRYSTVVAEARHRFVPRPTDAESLEVAWVPVDDVTERRLLPAFASAWPDLKPLLGRRALLVVDGANVVGSRPDGWWRDRPGAARRLHAAIAAALPAGFPGAALDLPADRWWPDVVLVLEGDARRADVGPSAPRELAPAPTPWLAVARANGSGDDEIVTLLGGALGAGGYTDAVVITADRALSARVRAAGAAVVGPATLLSAL